MTSYNTCETNINFIYVKSDMEAIFFISGKNIKIINNYIYLVPKTSPLVFELSDDTEITATAIDYERNNIITGDSRGNITIWCEILSWSEKLVVDRLHFNSPIITICNHENYGITSSFVLATADAVYYVMADTTDKLLYNMTKIDIICTSLAIVKNTIIAGCADGRIKFFTIDNTNDLFF